LTNVLKHADARHAVVSVAVKGDALVVTVSDDGRGDTRMSRNARAGSAAREGGAGLGLAGMRERVRILGGDLSAGGTIEGAGFTVRARLPLEG
jgi:signal transduction histidine kinase